MKKHFFFLNLPFEGFQPVRSLTFTIEFYSRFQGKAIISYNVHYWKGAFLMDGGLFLISQKRNLLLNFNTSQIHREQHRNETLLPVQVDEDFL